MDKAKPRREVYIVCLSTDRGLDMVDEVFVDHDKAEEYVRALNTLNKLRGDDGVTAVLLARRVLGQ